MFLLLIEDEVKDNGKIHTYRPFQITIAGVGNTFASFVTDELADYLKSFLKLDIEYNAVNIMQVDKEKISDYRYLCVFRTKKEVRDLLDAHKKIPHPNRLVEIATIRSDID